MASTGMEYTDENVPSSCRVKLYQLESEGNWLDQGTGFVSCSPLQAAEGPCMVISREEDSAVLLQSRIVLDDVYERQGESIIMWRETSLGWGQDVDYAISFQDSSGCFSVWEYICFVREHFRGDEEGYFDEQTLMLDHDGAMLGRSVRISSFDIPVVSAETLPDIVDIFTACSSNSQQKRAAAQHIVGNRFDFIQHLVQLSNELAEKEDFSACGRVSDVMKQIAYLNDMDIINYLVSDEAYLLVAGVWEYDAALRYKEQYKVFLSSPAATPKRALSELSFSDGDALINFLAVKLFRLRFMKDVMLRPLIDEGGAGALASAVQCTTAELCERLFSDHKYLKAILATIERPSSPSPALSTDSSLTAAPSPQTRTATFSSEPPDERAISPQSDAEDPDEPAEKIGGLRRAGSGVSTSTLSTVSAVSADSPLPSPLISTNGSKSSLTASAAGASPGNDQALFSLSSINSNGNNGNTPHTAQSFSHDSDSVDILSDSMQRMMVASSSAAPTDGRSSEPDTRGACIKFLRELFALSRNLTFEKRAELYSVFLDGARSAFFNAMLEVLRCGPSVEWILSLNGEKASSGISGDTPKAVSREEFSTLQEERESETYHRLCAMEILSTLACICPNTLRSFILEGPIPKPIVQGNLFGGLGVVRQYGSSADTERYPVGSVVASDPSKLTTVQAMRKHNSKCLLYVVIARLLAETNEMVMEHVGDILHSILDPECRTDSVVDRERFAVAVNDCYLPWLVVCFLECYRDNAQNGTTGLLSPIVNSPLLKPYLNAAVYYSSVRVISEALCFCCSALGYRIKYFILRNQLVSKVLATLLGSGQKVVYLHGIKFVFALVKTKDDMNFKQWAKLDVLKPLFDLMVNLSSRDNLLLSAIIELIDYIRAENIKPLIEYIVERHSDSFANVVYQGETFEKLSTKYAQIKDAEDDILTRSGSGGFPQNFRENVESSRRMKFSIQDAEESYFQDDDDDSVELEVLRDGSGPHSMDSLALLQGYADDDDDEIGPKPAQRSSSLDEEDCVLCDDMFGDSPSVSNSSVDRKNKKRRLSSIGGYSSTDRPDKIKIAARGDAGEDAIFPGLGPYTSPAADSTGKAEDGSSSDALPGAAILQDSPDVPAPTILSDGGIAISASTEDDAAPPLPPLRSKYDSSSDEEDNSSTSSGDKSFLNALFRRNPVASSTAKSDDSASKQNDSKETSKSGGIFSFSLKTKTKYFS